MDPVSEQVSYRPTGLLGRFVERSVGYREAGQPPGVHAGLPSRSLTLVISFGAPVDLSSMPDRSQRPERFTALVGGLHAAPAMIRHDGNQHGVQLDVTPLGARALFGLPAAALAWQVVPLESLLGPVAAELVERLSEASRWAERFALLDDVLLRAACEPAPTKPEVEHTWRTLVRSDGARDVASLADEVGWSRRHLSQQFRTEFGLTPKVAARVMRFERARSLVEAAENGRLADVAASAGYADQAHMTREWQTLAGASPTAWLAEG